MKKLVLGAVVATALVGFAAPSHADPLTDPQGQKCAMNSSTDVTREAGWQLGVVRGGPLAGPSGASGTLKCSIHVNNDTHSGAASVTLTGSTGPVSVIQPTEVNYQATAADDVSVCAEWVPAVAPPVGTGILYWVSGNTTTGDLGHWSTDPNASCGVALSIEPNDPECSIWLAIDQRAGTNIAEIWQDCEPYSPII
jgi:hypothetical protein